MQRGLAAHRSNLSEDDDRALASAFVDYTGTATFWLLFPRRSVGRESSWIVSAPEAGGVHS